MLRPNEGWRLVTYLAAPDFADKALPRDPIELGSLLGRGSFGTVYQGVWQGRPVAVKVIPHSARDACNELTNEASLILKFNHPNVLKVCGSSA